MFTINLRGLELYGYHGVPDEEQAVGHRYLIDLELTVEGNAPKTDLMEGTVNYDEVCRLVAKLFEKKTRTLERLALTISEAILSKFAKVQHVHIVMAKQLPPTPFILESAAVELEVGR